MKFETSILMQNVNLHYVSWAVRETSLKAHLFALLRRKKHSERNKDVQVHAIKQLNLTIRRGEKIALLGHNGAGKSTFLRIIAGLYPISSGTVSVRGTVRSIFELSTGFEVEATGRENILYRGLLLGLKPKQIRAKIDDIIEFADIGEFIDYPFKTYSAGMQIRLAFAISTSFTGEILLLDEIISAGDAAFMKKAKTRMQALASASEILILASHDMSALAENCERGLVLDHGTLAYDGDISSAIKYYHDTNVSQQKKEQGIEEENFCEA